MTWCEMPTAVSVSVSGATNQPSLPLPMSSSSSSNPHSCCTTRIRMLLQSLHHMWLLKIRSPFYATLSIVCSCFSALILWSEMVLASQLRSPIAYLMGAYDDAMVSDESSVLVQAVAFVFLAYMSICTYWSLFRINLGWAYSLQGPQQSSPSSLIFNAEYFSRLQFTLGYNFLVILHAPR